MYQGKIDAEFASPDPEFWRVPMWEGNIFNHENYHRYATQEVTIDKINLETGDVIERYRIDSYAPDMTIVERKNTQLAGVLPDTAKGYIRQAVTQYSPNRPDLLIADTPGTRSQLGHIDGAIGGHLQGQLTLEVPVQIRPVPEEIIRYANESRVTIVDVKGTRYNNPHAVEDGAP